MENEKPKKKSGYAYLQERLEFAMQQNTDLRVEIDLLQDKVKRLRQRLKDAESDYLKEYHELWHWLGPVRRFAWKLKHGQL